MTALAALMLFTLCRAALADRYDDFVSAVQPRKLTLTEGNGAGQNASPGRTREDFLNHDSAIQFIDLPGGGFIAVWGEVTILDDQPEAHTITPHPENDGQFIIRGERLVELASAPSFTGGKTLIINRSASGDVRDITLGTSSGFDAEASVVSLAETTADPHSAHPLNYIAGFQAPTQQSAGAINTLLRSGGHQYPFDLKDIPINLDITVDLKGYFEADGSVPSADFWPWEFDLRAQCSVTMHVESFELHFTSPSVNKTFDIIPINVPIVPDILTLDCSPKFFLSGMMDGNLDFGFEFTLGGELHIDSSYSASFHPIADSDSWLNSADIRAELYVGLNFGASLDILGVCAIGLNYKVGLVTEAKLFTNEEEEYRWHACRDFECLQGNIHPRKGPLTIDLDLLDGLLTETLCTLSDATDYDPLVSFHDSFTYGGGLRLTSCPHYGYRLDVQVTNQAGGPIEGAKVTCEGCGERYETVTTDILTGSDGIATLYIPDRDPADAENISTPGYTVTLSASFSQDGQNAVVSEPLTFSEQGLGSDGKPLNPTATLTLDIPSYTVAWYIDNYDGAGVHTEPLMTQVRYGVPGSAVTVTEADKSMMDAEGHPVTASECEAGKTYYLFDEQADNVLSGTVAQDGSLTLKLYFGRTGIITFDANGGVGEMEPIYAIFGHFVPLPPPSFYYPQDGMAFEGWDCFDMISPPSMEVALTEDEVESLVVKAAWKEMDFGTPDLALPTHLTRIEAEAFRGISAARISVPASCETIGSNAFADIDHPLCILIPPSCVVQEDAFAGCEKVYIFSLNGSSAHDYCSNHDNCAFVYWSRGWDTEP